MQPLRKGPWCPWHWERTKHLLLNLGDSEDWGEGNGGQVLAAEGMCVGWENPAEGSQGTCVGWESPAEEAAREHPTKAPGQWPHQMSRMSSVATMA